MSSSNFARLCNTYIWKHWAHILLNYYFSSSTGCHGGPLLFWVCGLFSKLELWEAEVATDCDYPAFFLTVDLLDASRWALFLAAAKIYLECRWTRNQLICRTNLAFRSNRSMYCDHCNFSYFFVALKPIYFMIFFSFLGFFWWGGVPFFEKCAYHHSPLDLQTNDPMFFAITSYSEIEPTCYHQLDNSCHRL